MKRGFKVWLVPKGLPIHPDSGVTRSYECMKEMPCDEIVVTTASTGPSPIIAEMFDRNDEGGRSILSKARVEAMLSNLLAGFKTKDDAMTFASAEADKRQCDLFDCDVKVSE